MTYLLLVVAAVFVALFALSATFGQWRRSRAIARMQPFGIRRLDRNVAIRATLLGVPPFLGLDPEQPNELTGDMALADERFVLVVDRGVLAELTPERGRRFTSVRCTGPKRLVIEGDVPRPDGTFGSWRFEIAVDDAEGWAIDLGAFVESKGERPYAIRLS